MKLRAVRSDLSFSSSALAPSHSNYIVHGVADVHAVDLFSDATVELLGGYELVVSSRLVS